MGKVIVTDQDFIRVASYGNMDVLNAIDVLENEEKVKTSFTEDMVDWNNIPDSEKVSDIDISFLEAKEQGILDGARKRLNKELSEAVRTKDVEKLKEIRRSLGVKDSEMKEFEYVASHKQ